MSEGLINVIHKDLTETVETLDQKLHEIHKSHKEDEIRIQEIYHSMIELSHLGTCPKQDILDLQKNIDDVMTKSSKIDKDIDDFKIKVAKDIKFLYKLKPEFESNELGEKFDNLTTSFAFFEQRSGLEGIQMRRKTIREVYSTILSNIETLLNKWIEPESSLI